MSFKMKHAEKEVYKAEYIWTDGTIPTALMRSKTMILPLGTELPLWSFDGSSTNQASGKNSDCVLRPVHVVPDPIRRGSDVLVLCEVLQTDLTPHPTNTRAACLEIHKQFQDFESWFGLEQEYTFMSKGRPLGFPEEGYPAPQGPYYCGVGGTQIYGREMVEEHLQACLDAGLHVSGINAEVMPGQWEFQIGPVDAITVSDELILARWLLCRIAEEYGLDVTFDAKPARGDWNGAGCHTNFSTNQMREAYEPCIDACEALAKKAILHVKNYGHGIEQRLTGAHETQRWNTFSYGVSDRGASVRIPWQVEKNQKGYIEDRRPNANCDPYLVTRLINDTICSYAKKKLEKNLPI